MSIRKTFGLGPINCWCGSPSYTTIKGEWKSVPQTNYTLRNCLDCGTHRTIVCTYNDRPDALYKDGFNRSRRHVNSLETIKKYCSGSVLDIGCNTGQMLNAMRDCNKFSSLEGIDYNLNAIAWGRTNFTLNLNNDGIDDLINKGKKYDSLIMVHTFEHVAAPIDFLRQLPQLLDIDGSRLIYICVPNIEGAHIPSYGALAPEAHYWHYTQSSIESLIKMVYEKCDIIFSGKSGIWGNNDQLEIVFKLSKDVE